MIDFLKIKGTWQEVKASAMTTISKEAGDKEPSSEWKRRILLSEHSPIRRLMVNWKWKNLPYFVSTHFVRHKFGIDHWVSTQRTDRTDVNRNEKFQDAPVIHEAEANAQAIINISRKRLCSGASPETREAWKEFLRELAYTEPELARCCVRDCIYRGYCYEYMSCGYHKTEAFQKKLKQYRQGINE